MRVPVGAPAGHFLQVTNARDQPRSLPVPLIPLHAIPRPEAVLALVHGHRQDVLPAQDLAPPVQVARLGVPAVWGG
eukprot:9076768-Pyramimonas_sp.AAC.1